MAFLNITVNIPADVVTQTNQRILADSTKALDSTVSLRNLLDGALAGTIPCEIKVAVTNVDPAVAAAGGGVSADLNLR